MTEQKAKKPKPQRRGLGFKPEDLEAIARIQTSLERTHGKLAVMAIIRMALLKLDREGL